MKKVPSLMEDTFRRSKAQIDRWVKKNYPEGKEVTWIDGKYAGRKAQLKNIFWELGWRAPRYLEILVTVRTYKKDGTGFIDDNDYYHRCYREIERYYK